MSSASENSDVLSSVPSSPAVSTTHSRSPRSSPASSPLKQRKYGRESNKVDYSDELSSEDECSSDQQQQPCSAPCELSDNILDNQGDQINNFDDSDSSASSSYHSSCSGSVLSAASVLGGDDSSDVESNDSGSSSDVEPETDVSNFAQKLFNGSISTTDEAVLFLMELYIQRRWDQTTLGDILTFCCKFFPSNLPKTLYKLFQYVENLTPSTYCEVKHFYCSDCLTPKSESADRCPNINCTSSNTGVFFELPVSTQLKHFFEYRKLFTLIDSYRNVVGNSSDTIFDICSGRKYKQIKENIEGPYNITLAFNSDGVSLVRSSKAHLYPILATISEIPPQFRSGYMVVCGIWYDPKCAPKMNNFLRPFVNSMKELSVEGVSWTHPEKGNIKSIVTAPVLVADALGRADMLLVQRTNSKHACNSCEQKAVRVPNPSAKNKRKLRRFVFQEERARPRESSRMEEQGNLAARTGQAVKGVTGNAIISQIPHFERCGSAVPEYMHCVLLGVVKLLITLWVFVPGEWNLKDRVKIIDEFIRSHVKVTDHFSRIPKGLIDFKLWKANDLRTWLLFVSLPALIGILPEKFLQHYMYFVSAIYVLLQEQISQADINVAEMKLRLFVRDFGPLYRESCYVYNVHNVLHLCEYVRNWGPLWATSAFPFESFNHILGELAHGTKNKGQEMVKRLKLAHGVQILKSKVGSVKVDNIKDELLGRPVDVSVNYDLPSETEIHVRARFNNDIFTSETYDRNKRKANSYVKFFTEESSGYGRILCFYSRGPEIWSLIKNFQVQHSKMFHHNDGKFKIAHLIPFKDTDTVISVRVACLTKSAKVGDYLCLRPNAFEKNL